MKKVIGILIVVLLTGFIGRMLYHGFLQEEVTRIEVKDWIQAGLEGEINNHTIVVDSGHGGKDPGKISVTGEYEKDINLEISLLLKKELVARGFEVVMTRETDIGLYQESDTNKKMADLKKRVSIMNDSEADVVVSIHQNSFSDQSSKGAQVFYMDGSEEGKSLAELLQKELKEKVDPENHRMAKANGDYYLLKNTNPVTVILECGFLSNPKEAERLSEVEYQEVLVSTIADGLEKYLQ